MDVSLFASELQRGATPRGEAGDGVMLILEVEDVDREVARLRAHAVDVVGEPRDEPSWELRVAYVRDPDGNLREADARYSGR